MGKSADAFRTISEAAAALELPQHVLRFWETRFSQIKPLKRGGGRRYYRPEDILLLKGIRHLLYDQGFTIKGVQRILKEEGPRHAIAIGEAGSLEALEKLSDITQPDTSGTAIENQTQESVGGTQSSVPATSNAGLTGAERNKLSKVLRELLECKRLLDNARDE